MSNSKEDGDEVRMEGRKEVDGALSHYPLWMAAHCCNHRRAVAAGNGTSNGQWLLPDAVGGKGG
jgi:hypothetical protein